MRASIKLMLKIRKHRSGSNLNINFPKTHKKQASNKARGTKFNGLTRFGDIQKRAIFMARSLLLSNDVLKLSSLILASVTPCLVKFWEESLRMLNGGTLIQLRVRFRKVF